MPKQLKYTLEQMLEFLEYAKTNKTSIVRTLKHFEVNSKTFYMTAYRYNMNVGRPESLDTQATNRKMVEKVLATAKAKRISHKKACVICGYSYNTYRVVIIRLHIKPERYSSRYSIEDVQQAFDYASANCISLSKACDHFGYNYHLLSPAAKRYGLKFEMKTPIYDEAKELSDRDLITFYLAKGYKANEINKAMKQLGRKMGRGMIYYFAAQAKITKPEVKI